MDRERRRQTAAGEHSRFGTVVAVAVAVAVAASVFALIGIGAARVVSEGRPTQDVAGSSGAPSERAPVGVNNQNPSSTERIGFLALAPEGTHASLPAVGELVISFDNFCCRGQTLLVYADGRMVWSQVNVVEPEHEDWVRLVPQRANKWETGYLEQRLTHSGVELLRSELLSTGLFEKSVTFKGKGYGYGLGVGVRNGGRMIRLRASSGRDPVGATAEQARAIERVTAILKDPAAWLPEGAWADRTIRAFVPARYLVVMHFYSSGGQTPNDPAELPPPADELLRRADEVNRSSSCQIVTASEARQIHRELRNAFGPDLVIPYGGIFGSPVTVQSALPHVTTCSQGVWG